MCVLTENTNKLDIHNKNTKRQKKLKEQKYEIEKHQKKQQNKQISKK